MEIHFTAEEQAFREQVKSFLRKSLPEELAKKVERAQHLSKNDLQFWHATLHVQGWLAPHWPVEYGGTGWTPIQGFIFEYECALANAPRVIPFGVNMLGPVLIKYGSEEQKSYWLPRILDGSDWWCQGFSEPDAGSDLANLKMKAVRDGDNYIVNGQKTWTTLGQYANMIFCLVRTDSTARKQAGITFLLIDMNTPGVEVRPIVTLDGGQEINEVFFNNVKVPVNNRVGDENKGWTYAKYLLTYERTNIAGVGFSVATYERLRRLARTVYKNGRPLDQDPLFAARLARVYIDLECMKITNLRIIAAAAGKGLSHIDSSMLKILGTRIRQELTALMRRAVGPYAQPFILDAMADENEWLGPAETASASVQYFNNRKLSIYGGSNEIQRNIIARTVLGV